MGYNSNKLEALVNNFVGLLFVWLIEQELWNTLLVSVEL